MTTALIDVIRAMSISARIELVDAILESISTENTDIGLSDAQKKELQRRLDAYERDPNAGDSWEAVRERIRAHS